MLNCQSIFEADSVLKNRGFGDFGSPSGRGEIIENCIASFNFSPILFTKPTIECQKLAIPVKNCCVLFLLNRLNFLTRLKSVLRTTARTTV